MLRMVGGGAFAALVGCSATDSIEPQPNFKTVLLETQQNVCPQVTGFNVSPLSAAIQGHIDVSSVAEDVDGNDELEFFWLASSGMFEDATASKTRYICAEPGTFMLHLVVSDGECGDERWLPIQCVNVWVQDASAAETPAVPETP